MAIMHSHVLFGAQHKTFRPILSATKTNTGIRTVWKSGLQKQPRLFQAILHGYDSYSSRTYSRRPSLRGRWGRRRRRRRACRSRSWTFVVGQSRSRTRPAQTSDVHGRSLSRLLAVTNSSRRRRQAACRTQPGVLAGSSALART